MEDGLVLKNNLKEIRTEQGISQAQLANMVGMCTLLILKQCDIKCIGSHEKKRELQKEY